MREEPVVEGEQQRPGEVASLWLINHRITAILTTVALIAGLVLGRVTNPEPAPVLPAASVVPAATADAIETDVAGAVEVRSGSFVPTSTDHLVVVALSATTCEERASGTGVLIAPDIILTAAHVVGDAGLIRIDHGGNVFTGEVLGVFEDGRDLALVTVPAPLSEPISLGRTPRAGEPVTMVGHPLGGAMTSTVGPTVDVPSLARTILRGELLAVSSPTPEGMSGGPAVNADGELIGLVVAAQPGTDTAIIVTFETLEPLLDAPLVDGRCPEVT